MKVFFYFTTTHLMIILLLLIPIIASIVIAITPTNPNAISLSSHGVSHLTTGKDNNFKLKDLLNKPYSVEAIKLIAITASLVNFFISLFLWFQFDSSTTQFQFVQEFQGGAMFGSSGLNLYHFNFGIDGISIYFVILTTFITPIALLSNYNNIDPTGDSSEGSIGSGKTKLFLISFLLLESLQICAFVSLDLLLFYVFFESILPIVFILIIIFGHGEDRFRSAFLFFLFTLAGSLPMLLSILTIYSFVGSTDFNLISLNEISLESQKILWLGFFLAFAVKTPLMPFSIWLPKAHSDSPLAGSILLAGTMLKLATYGYLRVLINFLPDATNYFSPLVQTIAIITLVYASLSTIVQHDSKKLVAYSSIAHMSVCVMGLFSNTIQGIEGALLLSLAHGWVSPALFICVGGVLYDRTHTRNIHYLRGFATYMPVFTIMFFAFTLANAGIPLSLNFLGEQMALMGAFIRNPFTAIIGATGIVTSAMYSLYLYNRISYGSLSPHLVPFKDLDRREYYLLLSLLIPTFLFGIFPNIILDSLHVTVSSLLYSDTSTGI